MVFVRIPRPWLLYWQINNKFYGSTCEKHKDKVKTVFCCKCLKEPVCKNCWEESVDHQGHQSIQVFAVCERPSVEDESVGQIFNASDIQGFKINGRWIVFFNPTRQGLEEKEEIKPKCRTCETEIVDFKYKYCSIACKHNKLNTVESSRFECIPYDLPCYL